MQVNRESNALVWDATLQKKEGIWVWQTCLSWHLHQRRENVQPRQILSVSSEKVKREEKGKGKRKGGGGGGGG